MKRLVFRTVFMKEHVFQLRMLQLAGKTMFLSHMQCTYISFYISFEKLQTMQLEQ